ncbi:MAG: hypothetical protein IJ728_07330 [Selenomonadaceae bacterium]|nr:hypothetical protein [Selenomonadaceae bacterium]
MNERGIISLTALCMMFVISIAILTVTKIAERQADIVSLYRFENKLQNIAESSFNETIYKFENGLISVENFNYDSDYGNRTLISSKNLDDGQAVKITTYVKKSGKILVVMTLAEIQNYFYNSEAAYHRVAGYMEQIETVETEDERYEFKSYIK